ncbi:uncharacterized protein O3C94_014661 isoform 2-T4 [Discoglossus pictus]
MAQSCVGPLKSTPKKRKEKFSDPENHALVDEIIAHLDKLFGPKSCKSLHKAAIWDAVVKKVNKQSSTKRTLMDCKKRWSDYKRKIKFILTRWANGSYEEQPLEEILTKRQLRIAKFFKMDTENTSKTQELSEDSSLEEVSTSLPTILFSGDSVDDFVNSSKRSSLVSNSFVESGHQEQSTSQHGMSQSSQQASNADEFELPTEPTPNISSLELKNFDTKLDQLIAQQNDTYEILQNMHSDIRAFLDLQKKTCRFLKQNFIEQQKSIISTQKISCDHGKLLDLSLKSLHNKIDELKNTFTERKLQDLLSSEKSDEGLTSSSATKRKCKKCKKKIACGNSSQSPQAKRSKVT